MVRSYPSARRISAAFLMGFLLFVSVGCMKSPEEKYAAFMENGQAFMEKKDYASALIEFKNAARIKSNEAEPFYQMAVCNLNQGQTQEAVDAVQQAVRLNPDHVEANLLLARFMVRAGGAEVLPQVEEMLNGVLGQNPENSEALFVLATTRARQGSADDAERLLREALKKSPEHLNSAMALARLSLNKGDRDGAEKTLQDAVNKSEADDKKMAKIVLGQFYAGLGEDDKAMAQYEQILADNPDYGPALLGVGQLNLKHNERDKAEEVYKKLSNLDEEQYKTLYAQILMLNGKSNEAIAEYERLSKANPANRQLRSALVNSYLQTGQDDKAEQVLTDVINSQPKDSDARLQRAEVYRRAGRLDKAQEDLTQVLEVKPNSHEAHYFLSKIHEARRDQRLQRQELDEALRIEPGYLPARLEMAQSLLAGANPASALDVLNEAPENQVNTAPIIAAKVWALIAMKNFDQARAMLDKIPQEQRDVAEFNLQEGVLRSAKGDFASAQTFLARSLEQNPQDLRTLNAYAATYASQKKMAKALEVVRQHAEKYPKSPRLQLALAGWYERANYPREARAAYRAAHEAGDLTGEASIMTARLDAADGKHDEAVKTLKELLDKSPRNVGAWQMLGLIEDNAGNVDAAVAAYRQSVTIQPDNFVALNNLAYLLSTKDVQLDEALSFAQKAKELNPQSPEVDDTIGWIYYLRGVYATAAVHLKAAAAGNPKNPVTLYHLAMAQAKNGDVSGARRSYDAAFKLEPGMPEAKEAKSVIDAAN